MKIYRTRKGIIIEEKGAYYLSRQTDWDAFVNRANLGFEILREIQKLTPDYDYKLYIQQDGLPPLASQEVWLQLPDTSNVFVFKSTPQRVAGHNEQVYLRRDATQTFLSACVALFINSQGQIAAFSLANSLQASQLTSNACASSCQLSQYQFSTAIGPCLYLPDEPPQSTLCIRTEITREKVSVCLSQSNLSLNMQEVNKVIQEFQKELHFPAGFFLLLPLPDSHLSQTPLQISDTIRVTWPGVGTLQTTVSARNRS